MIRRGPVAASSSGSLLRDRVPLLTLGTVAAALAASLLPGTPEALEFRRDAIAAGEWWRLAGAHLVHYWPGMAVVDLSLLLVFGGWVERRTRPGWIALVLASACASSAAIWYLRTDLARFRGSSAVTSSMFSAIAVSLLIADSRWLVRVAAALSLAAYGSMLWLQTAQTTSFSVAPLPPGVDVAVTAHAAGCGTGVVLALCAWRWRAPRETSRRS